MMFHEKLDTKLIRLVRDNPVLFDYHNVKYMDFDAREVAWQKIGDELKRPAADCKVRWINIRDVYRRILKKSIASGGRRPVKYKYENEISFLRPFYKDVKLQNEEFESDEIADQGNDCPNAQSDESSLDEPIKNKVKIKKNVKIKKERSSFDEVIDPISTPTDTDSEVPAEFNSADPVDAFLLSIGATLKTFSPYHLNVAKTKIFNVVQEHDLQQIVQRQSNESTSHDAKNSESETMFIQ